MKKTQRIDAIRNIKKRVVSYLSVSLVIILGLGGYLVSSYLGAGIRDRATEYFGERNLKPIEMVSSLGVSDDDIARIRAVEGVTNAEGLIQSDGSLGKGSDKFNVTVISLTEFISIPEVLEGRKPTEKNECMVGEDFAIEAKLKVGDTVTISVGDIEGESPLLSETFTITALMHHPNYVRRRVYNIVSLPLSAYNTDVTRGLFTNVYVSTDVPKAINIFSDEYFDRENAIRERLEALSEELGIEDQKRTRREAEKLIDDEWAKAEEEIEKARKEIDDGEKKLQEELENARALLESAEQELADKVAEGERELRNAEALLESELADARAKIADAEAELKTYEDFIAMVRRVFTDEVEDKLINLLEIYDSLDTGSEAGLKKLAETLLSYEDTVRQIRDLADSPEAVDIARMIQDSTGINAYDLLERINDLDVDALFDACRTYLETGEAAVITPFLDRIGDLIDVIRKIIDGIHALEAKVAEGEAALADAKTLLEEKEAEGRAKIEEGWNTLYSEKAAAEEKIANGWAEYNVNKEKYEKEIADARAKLEEEVRKGKEKVAEAKESLEIPEGKWIVLDRSALEGFVDVKSNVDAVETSSRIFGVLFILISGMVCFSTLAIIIEEQKEMVGTSKAFGFRKREVLGKYLTFGVSAAVLGCVLGTVLALIGATFLDAAYAKAGMYQFGETSSRITVLPTAIGWVLMIGICALSTVIACTDILRSPAAILMKGGKVKKESTRKSVSHKGGSLYSRLIIRNMMNDKARVIASIIIIASSCFLVGIGISLKLAYDGMSEKQISDVHLYDVRVSMSSSTTDQEKAEIEQVFKENNLDYISAINETLVYRWNNKLNGVSVIAGEPEMLRKFYAVNKVGTTEPIDIPSDGILIQNKMQEAYGINSGDTITILDSTLEPREATVLGTFQNYVGRTVVTSIEGYEKVFEKEYVPNCYYVKGDGATGEALKNKLISISDELSFELEDDFSTRFNAVSMLYTIIVFVTTGIAILMSFMILTNLANIFVNRKKTELIVMRINGFSIKKTINYLARETVFTTFAGIVLGVIMGSLGAPIIIKVMENPDLQFVRTFHIPAWIIAVVLEVIFAIIINKIAFNKVKKLDLRDIE